MGESQKEKSESLDLTPGYDVILLAFLRLMIETLKISILQNWCNNQVNSILRFCNFKLCYFPQGKKMKIRVWFDLVVAFQAATFYYKIKPEAILTTGDLLMNCIVLGVCEL